jgi:hypothetical protein
MSDTPHLRTETDPVSKMLCHFEYQMMDKVQNPSKRSVIRHRQNPLESKPVSSSYQRILKYVVSAL